MTDFEPMTFTGSRGPYRWFVTKHDDLSTLIESCPQSLACKYIAVTSLDSGPKILTDEEKGFGWQSRNDIAYSPKLLCRKMAISEECGRVNAADTTNGTSLSHLTTLAHFATAMFLNLTCRQAKSGPS